MAQRHRFRPLNSITRRAASSRVDGYAPTPLPFQGPQQNDMTTGDWHQERPNALHSAYNHIATDRSRFSRKWHQSAFHKNTSDANRALIGVIYDAMKRFEESLAREIKKDKDEDKAMAIAASIAADPEANRDLD